MDSENKNNVESERLIELRAKLAYLEIDAELAAFLPKAEDRDKAIMAVINAMRRRLPAFGMPCEGDARTSDSGANVK